MLASLSIQNVVLIEKLTIEFEQGLCALTGETGAGKSILLDSLGLALGMRAESSLVRKGSDKAQVSAVFTLLPDHPLFAYLRAQDLECDPGEEIVLRRSLTADGRSRAFVNDQPVSVSTLKALGEMLIEIHGQFDTRGLLNPSNHGAMLDEYAGLDNGPLAQAWQAWQEAESAYRAMLAQSQKAQEDEEYLRQSVHDLDALEPKEGEEQSLAMLRERLMHREKVMDGLNEAYNILDHDGGAPQKAAAIIDRISAKAGQEPSAEIIAALDRASAEIDEAIALISSLSADMNESEHDLETIDDRLFALRAQARKHGCDVDALAAKRDELASQLDLIENQDQHLEQQKRKTLQLRDDYMKEAQAISAKRSDAGDKLSQLVQKELPPLKLDKARFVVTLEQKQEDEWSAQGMDRVRFVVATNPGAEPGPLNKIASGGELSRFMLALKVVMAETGTAPTLMFDEVDAGIGGATADAVGERLSMLSRSRQIMVVTHAPQVAARASHHYIVRKDGIDEVKTNVVHLNDVSQRREEIARMLAGATITDEARAAAKKLLENVA